MSPRRVYRLPGVYPPLDPAIFIRRLPEKVGTEYGRLLVDRAIDAIEQGADPDAWIQVVLRARDAGVIGAGLARFLVYAFAEAVLQAVLYTDPVLGTIMRRIDEIRAEHGMHDDEDWRPGSGPPEWEILTRRWEVAADALMDKVVHRNGETDFSAKAAHKDDPLIEEGRRLVVGATFNS